MEYTNIILKYIHIINIENSYKYVDIIKYCKIILQHNFLDIRIRSDTTTLVSWYMLWIITTARNSAVQRQTIIKNMS